SRGRLAPTVSPYDKAVLASDGTQPHRALRNVIVDLQNAVLFESAQFSPVIERIANRLAVLALGQNLAFLLAQELLEAIQDRHASFLPRSQSALRILQTHLILDVT